MQENIGKIFRTLTSICHGSFAIIEIIINEGEMII